MLGTLSKREKTDWRSFAKSSQTCNSLRCTRLSGVHWTMFDAQSSAPSEQVALKKNSMRPAIIHRTVWCAPDCPVSQPCPRQRSVARSVGDTWSSPMVGRSHQTVQCATGLSGVPRGSWLQRSASPDKGGNHALFIVRWCTGLSGAPTDRRQLWPSKWSSNGS